MDRPVDTPFLALDRKVGAAWRTVDDDLGLRFVWEESDGDYTARYEVPADARPGTYRLRVLSGSYTLTTRPFAVVPGTGLRVLGARLAGSQVLFLAQNPRPDAQRSVAWRPVSPQGGALRFDVGGRTTTARYDAARGGWVAPAGALRKGARVSIPAGGLVDGAGNRSGAAVAVVVGEVAPADWPPHLGTGGGRTPGPFGEGTWPP